MEHGDGKISYGIDYAVASRSWNKPQIADGFALPNNTVASECTAIGFTARAHEEWNEPVGKLRVECVGIPSYLGDVFPGVAGLAKSQRSSSSQLPEVTYLRGDATRPRGDSFRIVAQIRPQPIPVLEPTRIRGENPRVPMHEPARFPSLAAFQ